MLVLTEQRSGRPAVPPGKAEPTWAVPVVGAKAIAEASAKYRNVWRKRGNLSLTVAAPVWALVKKLRMPFMSMMAV
jgi:hypothetical protein